MSVPQQHVDGRKIRIRSTMKDMLQRLDSRKFQQTHRSAIVNISKVDEIGARRVVMQSGIKVPISRRRHRPLINEVYK